MFYAGDDGVAGAELWQADDREARLIADIWPGPPGALAVPDRRFTRRPFFVRAGDLLFFPANDGLTGCELWALPLGRAAGCSGDCDGDGQIGIAELVRAVNLALDGNGVTGCAAIDSNHDERVDIDELIAAVAAALRGCGPNG